MYKDTDVKVKKKTEKEKKLPELTLMCWLVYMLIFQKQSLKSRHGFEQCV
jgi:hypothetical protein